jgi:hypothetical protein
MGAVDQCAQQPLAKALRSVSSRRTTVYCARHAHILPDPAFDLITSRTDDAVVRVIGELDLATALS